MMPNSSLAAVGGNTAIAWSARRGANNLTNKDITIKDRLYLFVVGAMLAAMIGGAVLAIYEIIDLTKQAGAVPSDTRNLDQIARDLFGNIQTEIGKRLS